jgi:hypothetical protein
MVDFKKFLPKKEGKSEESYFWSLLIEPGWVQAGIWKIEDKRAQVLITSPTSPWEVEEDLISASDTCLSSAIQSFPENLSEPSKTVFGVPASWVNEGAIAEEHLEKIKRLCGELSLTPIGFVVLPEAIAHYKKSEEGSPLNAITLGVYKESLEITVFSMGSLVGTSQVARSVSIVDDVTEGLTRFSLGTNIPSRILLYDGKEGELEEVRQALLRVNWDDFGNLKFLHTPKVEILGIKLKVYAVSLAGASELAGVTSLEVVDVFEKEEALKLESRREALRKLSKSDSTESFGDEASTKKLTSLSLPETEVGQANDVRGVDVEDEATAEELGFAVEKDISTQGPTQEDEQPGAVSTEQNFIERGEITEKIDSAHENVGPVKRESGFFEKIYKFKEKVFLTLGSVKLPRGGGFSMGKRVFVLGPLFLVALIIIGFLYWWFIPRATVTIYVSPQRLEESLNVKIDTENGSGESGDILAGELVETSVQGEKTKDTTGTKTVGDRSKGEVTLYRVGSQLDLDAGTVINGPENLKFTLDADTTIASGSAGSAGTTKTNVTASDIGAQYNLAGGTTFTVSNYSTSDIEAKNENAFSGGSSREINAVSETDQEILEEDLVEELSSQAKGKLSEGMADEKYLIEESVTATASSKTFSAKVGDEASTLKVSMDVNAKAVLVEKSALLEYAKKYLSDKVPSGFVLRGEQITYSFEFEDENDGVYEFAVRVSANLLPEINTEDVSKKLKGKFPSLAEEFLNKEVPGFVRAEIKIKPVLPAKLTTLPHLEKNIDIVVAAER